MQQLLLPTFRSVTILKADHTSENLRRKKRQKFEHEGNHRLWNQGDSSCLVPLSHSIVGLTFIHQGTVKTSIFNNASSASDMPRAPPESSRIVVSVWSTAANTRQDTTLASSMVCVYFPALRLKCLPALRGTSYQVLALLLKTQSSKEIGNRGDHHGIYYKNNSTLLGVHIIQ